MADRIAEAYKAEFSKHIKHAGVLLEVIVFEEAVGGGWAAILDTEYAALKLYYVYRNTPGVNFGESPNRGGWFVSVKPDCA